MPLVQEVEALVSRLEAAPVGEVDWAEVSLAAARLTALAARRASEAAAQAQVMAEVERVLELREEIAFIELDVGPLASAPASACVLEPIVQLRRVLEEVSPYTRERPTSLSAISAIQRAVLDLAARATAALASALPAGDVLASEAPEVTEPTQPPIAPPDHAGQVSPNTPFTPAAHAEEAAAPAPPDHPATLGEAASLQAARVHAEPPPMPPLTELGPCAPRAISKPLLAGGAAPPSLELDEHTPEGDQLPRSDGDEALSAEAMPSEAADTDSDTAVPPASGGDAVHAEDTAHERWYHVGVDKLAAGDLAGANVLLEAAQRRPALPLLAVLEHVTFMPQRADVPRPPSQVLEAAVTELQRVAEEWTSADALLACTMMTALCVIDGLQDAGAPECLQRSRESIRSCPMWLEPFLSYWDSTHRPIVALRPFVLDERTARAAFDESRDQLRQRLDACRGMHFTFAAGNRFVGHVFPDRGGHFGWIDRAAGAESAEAAAQFAREADGIASLEPESYIDAECRELGEPVIVRAARNNISAKLGALREAVQAWRLACEALRNVGTQSSAFFAQQFRQLRQEIANIEPPPEDRDPDSKVVHRCATKMLERARFVIEGRG